MDNRPYRSRSTQEHLLRMFCGLLLIPYLALVLWLTLLSREPTHQRCMLAPFWEYRNMLSGNSQWFYFWQIVGNLVMLMPLGFMLPAISDFFRKGWRTAFLALFCSVAIELSQWFTARGLMEFDDVFNNTLGGIAGYLLFCCLIHSNKKTDHS